MSAPIQNILLIRPARFAFNIETELSNSFQKKPLAVDSVKEEALKEFDRAVEKLRERGINVIVFDDSELPHKPDAIFPNNWVTFHADGTVILYPMAASNRRAERRADIIDWIKKDFIVNRIIDLSEYEKEDKFLEGTGSVVFDHSNMIAYASLSPRTNKEVFLKLCNQVHYSPVVFNSLDSKGNEIYHTNVMMCIAEKFAVICLDCIGSEERDLVAGSLVASGHEIIDIKVEQMNSFAGNMLALQSKTGKDILVLSQSAFNVLTPVQRINIERYCELLPLSINTIETVGGGSARCMIAEIFLPLQPIS
jgi:hypothetical protein